MPELLFDFGNVFPETPNKNTKKYCLFDIYTHRTFSRRKNQPRLKAQSLIIIDPPHFHEKSIQNLVIDSHSTTIATSSYHPIRSNKSSFYSLVVSSVIKTALLILIMINTMTPPILGEKIDFNRRDQPDFIRKDTTTPVWYYRRSSKAHVPPPGGKMKNRDRYQHITSTNVFPDVAVAERSNSLIGHVDQRYNISGSDDNNNNCYLKDLIGNSSIILVGKIIMMPLQKQNLTYKTTTISPTVMALTLPQSVIKRLNQTTRSYLPTNLPIDQETINVFDKLKHWAGRDKYLNRILEQEITENFNSVPPPLPEDSSSKVAVEESKKIFTEQNGHDVTDNNDNSNFIFNLVPFKILKNSINDGGFIESSVINKNPIKIYWNNFVPPQHNNDSPMIGKSFFPPKNTSSNDLNKGISINTLSSLNPTITLNRDDSSHVYRHKFNGRFDEHPNKIQNLKERKSLRHNLTCRDLSEFTSKSNINPEEQFTRLINNFSMRDLYYVVFVRKTNHQVMMANDSHSNHHNRQRNTKNRRKNIPQRSESTLNFTPESPPFYRLLSIPMDYSSKLRTEIRRIHLTLSNPGICNSSFSRFPKIRIKILNVTRQKLSRTKTVSSIRLICRLSHRKFLLTAKVKWFFNGRKIQESKAPKASLFSPTTAHLNNVNLTHSHTFNNEDSRELSNVQRIVPIIRIIQKRKYSILVIHNPKHTHSGTYHCQAKTYCGTIIKSRKTTIKITYRKKKPKKKNRKQNLNKSSSTTENLKKIDNCTKQCLNGGTCYISMKIGIETCECPPYAYGEFCELSHK